MNKTLKMILCLVLVLCTVASFAACGGDDGIAGKYILDSMEAEGMTIDGDMLEAAMAAAGYSASDMYIKLNKDGTGVMSVMGQNSDMEYKDGKIWSVDEPDDKADFTVKGDKLTITVQGYKMTFKK